jgi:hypothetical protein
MSVFPISIAMSLRGRTSTGCGGSTSSRFFACLRRVVGATQRKEAENRTRIDTRLAQPPSAAQTLRVCLFSLFGI